MTWASTFMYSIIGRTQYIAWIYLHSWNLFIVDIADFFPFVHYMSYACHMPYGICHSVTCHPAEVTFPPLPQQSWYTIWMIFFILYM